MALLNPRLINRRNLFTVSGILKSKGFDVIDEGDGTNLLIPVSNCPSENCRVLFDAFNDSSYRQEVLSYISNDKYIINNIAVSELVNHSEFIGDRNRYSSSFEWYIGEMIVRSFSAFSASYGVKIKDVYRNSTVLAETGDYDTLVVSGDLNLIYFECKTGSFTSDKILKCIERSISLHCELTVIFVEGPLKINALKAKLRNVSHPILSVTRLAKIGIKSNEYSEVYEWGNCYFLDASKNIENQMRSVMRINHAKKYMIHNLLGLSSSDFDTIGYTYTEIT